jgi:putative transposase
MSSTDDTPMRVRWARLRFSIVGPLLHSPPEDRELATRLNALADQAWKHPTAGDVVRFSFKTIERWYYLAKSDDDPMRSLERKVPKHAGTHPAISPALGEAIERQYRDHPRWSYQLRHDNLAVLAREDPRLGRLPGYATIRRYLKDKGLVRAKRRPREEVSSFAPRETRSYEVTHVHGLWHLDFHPVLASGAVV